MTILSLPNSISLAWCRLEGESGHEAGRRLLSLLCRARTGQAPPPIALEPRGKPFFPGSPWHFSITHTPRHCFCALAPAPLGIDAEELDRTVIPRLADKILSPGELAQYRLSQDQNLALLKFWVLKEAAAKLTGQGLRGYPAHTNFSLDDPRVMTIDGCLLAVLQEEHHAV